MQFANPIWLLGLSGLLIPLAIHLLSRKEGKVIRIGSIRHLEETSTKQFKSIKLNELLLLVLRSLLVLWVTLLLSGLHLPDSNLQKTNWLLIEKGLEHDPDFLTLIDSLKEGGFEVRALSNDFPLLDDSVAKHPIDYWGLVESLKSKSLHQVVVISTNRASAFRGERVGLPENFKWITKALPPRTQVISSIQVGADSAWTREGKFSSTKSEFETFKAPYTSSLNTSFPDTLDIIIIRDKKFEYDTKVLQASLKAIDQFSPHAINILVYDQKEFSKSLDADWLIWLSDKKTPEINVNKIIMKQQLSKDLLRQEKSDEWLITKRLQPDIALKEHLALSLAGILFPEKEVWMNAMTIDVRAADERFLHSELRPQKVQAGITTDHDDIIWVVLIVLTIICERSIAYKRNQ